MRTDGKIAANHVLFVGVCDLLDFRYGQVRDFSKRVMEILASELPKTKHVAMTIHGVNFALDENESILAQLGGLIDAFRVGSVPPGLETITIVEINKRRAERIQQILEGKLSLYLTTRENETNGEKRILLPVPLTAAPTSISAVQNVPDIDEAGDKSDDKPHVFVATPFNKRMNDVLRYGITEPANKAGYLCERADTNYFTGEILGRIKSRIETADFVIADLTGANPNVYLEVGYAWAKDVPTIFIVDKEGDEKIEDKVCFDVKGYNIIPYDAIGELEDALEKAFQDLSRNRGI